MISLNVLLSFSCVDAWHEQNRAECCCMNIILMVFFRLSLGLCTFTTCNMNFP